MSEQRLATRQPQRGANAPEKAPPAPIPVGLGLASDPNRLGAIAEAVIAAGNLDALHPSARTRYLIEVCQSLGLNPLTRPFELLKLQGKTVLYLRKEGTEQLANLHGISTEVVSREQVGDLFIVNVRASQPGRFADAMGAVPCQALRGDELVNAMLKAETKARRRATLALLGLGWFDQRGDPDPDSMIDGNGNVAQRGPPRPLPQSSASTGEIFDDAFYREVEQELAPQTTAAAPPPAPQDNQPGAVASSEAATSGGPLPAAGASGPPPAPAPQSVPTWASHPTYGPAVSQLVDQLEAAGKKKGPPADDADEQAIVAWIRSAEGMLKHANGGHA